MQFGRTRCGLHCVLSVFFAVASFAAEKPRLRVDDYAITAEITPKTHHLRAEAKVAFTALDDISSALFELHNGLRVTSVTNADGDKLPAERISQENAVRVSLPRSITRNSSSVLTFTYEGDLGSADDSPVEGLKVAYVGEDAVELLYAGRWFPVSGYGINRFTSRINVTVPAGFTVIGSGSGAAAATSSAAAETSAQQEEPPPLVRHRGETPAAYARRQALHRRSAKSPSPVATGASGGRGVFSFVWAKPSFPGTIIAGKFQEVTANGNVHAYFDAAHKQFAQAYAESASKEFEYFSSLYGPPLSNRLNIVELPDDTLPSAWAPEIAAIATRAINQKVDYRLLANTIAHQWWGASVSPAGPEDSWLRDGGARYSEARYVESSAGEAGFSEAMRDVAVGALAYDNIPLASVGKLDPFSPEAQSLSTDKGAMILNMLRWVMGDAQFDKAMKQFATQFAGKPASTMDFQNIASQGYGQSLSWFFSQWLDSTGAPEFKDKYTIFRTPKGFRVSGQITQDLDLFRMPIELKVDTDGKPELKRIDVTGTESPYTIETYGRPRKITIDPNDRVLKNSPELKIRVAILKGEQLVQQGDLAAALTQLQKALDINKNSSLAHYRIAEVFFQQHNYQSAADEYRAAERGDGEPRWTEVWSHVQLGKIFDVTGQRERATNEYRQALETNDNTSGALDEARKYLGSPFHPNDKSKVG